VSRDGSDGRSASVVGRRVKCVGTDTKFLAPSGRGGSLPTAQLSADTSGRYLLLYQRTQRLQVADLASGQTRFIPGVPGGNANNMIDFAW
jgi:hypothetical protein